MSDPITDYQTRLQELTTARAAAEGLQKKIAQGAEVLRDWRTAMVSNTGPGIGFPAELAFSRGVSINARDWPSGDDIAVVLSNYHTAKTAAESSYRAIPESQRSVVTPPKN